MTLSPEDGCIFFNYSGKFNFLLRLQKGRLAPL